MLATTRQQVEYFLSSLGQPFRQDASNASPQFLRNRVRGELLPALERDYNPRLRQALCETAEVAAAENEFLDALVTSILAKQPDPELGIELDLFKSQPLALQRRILRRLCLPLSLALDFAQLESLRDFALAGRAGRFTLPRGFAAEILRQKHSPSRLSVLAPKQLLSPLAPYCIELPIPGSVSLAEFWNRKDMHIDTSLLDGTSALRRYNRDVLLSAKRVGTCLTVRNLLPGDRFRPLHSSGERKVNRLLQELSIPSALRRIWPVLSVADSIVWVPGLPVAEHVAWSPGDGEAVLVGTHS
jgi:tRNA(Ile)-lysidine synthase